MNRMLLSLALLAGLASRAGASATVIRYDIPGGSGDAWLTVADLQGTPVRRIPLDTAADSLTLSAGGLQPGMYQITLSVGGKDAGSERVVVLEKNMDKMPSSQEN